MGNITIRKETKLMIEELAKELNSSQSNVVHMAIKTFDSNLSTRNIITDHIEKLQLNLPAYYHYLLNTISAILMIYHEIEEPLRKDMQKDLIKFFNEYQQKRKELLTIEMS